MRVVIGGRSVVRTAGLGVKVARSRLSKQNRAAFVSMNSSEAQPESDFDSRMTYFDPEQTDTSEEQFAVSLEEAETPAFVIESEPSSVDQAPAQEPVRTDSPQPGIAHISSSEQHAQRSGDLKSDSVDLSHPAVLDSSADWRDLVSAKVSKYRSRKPHKDRYPSLQLPFEPEPPRRPRVEARSSNVQIEAERPPLIESLARTAPPSVLLESTARVLEFPRPTSPPARTDELAEPVFDRPRIIEAPELLPPPPAMGGILIEPPATPEPERLLGFDVPLQSASLERRAVAGAMDAALIAGASAGFAYIALRIIGTPLPLRLELISLLGLVAILWMAYQYVFPVFCARTPGLALARLEIRKFDGSPAPRNLRRWRTIASILSLASLGLGYAWCFLDEDQLTWHDRITRTHLALAPLRKQ